MAQAPERLAQELADVKRRLRAMERGGQLAHSSVNVGGEDFSLSDALGAGPAALAATADLEATALELQEAAAERDVRLATAETGISTAGERLTGAEADLLTAFGRLSSAEGTLAAVPDDIDAAKTAAISAAATDAQAKAATAEANAKNAAATDAQAKANAAKQAAIDAAAATAQTKADAAKDGAITAAEADATAKADAAEAAAIAVANAAQATADTAKADAATAQKKANDANALAGTAESKAQTAITSANTAQTSANNVSKNLFSTATPSGTAPFGSTWFQVNGTGEVTGQWQQTASGIASTWTPRPIRSEVISNLDVGKLSAGTATIADLVAQKIAGATASFQTVDIKNLFVTAGAVMDSATAQAIYTAKLSAGKILASEVLIGSGPNLIPNGRGEMGDSSGWAAPLNRDTADMPSGLPCSFRSAASSSTVQAAQAFFPVDPSTDYTFEVWLKADKADSKFYLELRDQAGANSTTSTAIAGETFAGSGGYPVSNFTVPTTWTRYRGRLKTAASTSKLRVGGLYFNHTNGTEKTATVWLAGMALTRATDGALLVDGAIDGKLITGATVRTAASGARVQMDTTGLSAYNSAGAETVRISGTDGSFSGTGNFTAVNTKGLVALTPSTQIGGGRPGVVLGGDSSTVYGPMLFGADPTKAAADGFAQGDAALVSGQAKADSQRSQLVLKQNGEIRLQAMAGALNGQGYYLDAANGATISAPKTSISGSLTVGGFASFPYEYAEFTSAVNVPNNVGWGPGTLTKDTGRSINGDFVSAGSGDRIVFNKGGMYQIGCVIDTGGSSASGVATIRFDPSAALITGGGKQGGAWEIPLSASVFINAGETLKWTFSQGSGAAQTWTTTIRVYRMK